MFVNEKLLNMVKLNTKMYQNLNEADIDFSLHKDKINDKIQMTIENLHDDDNS
jgi:hypothetical protein